MKKKRIIFLLFMTLLANFIFADTPVSGPSSVNELEIYSLFNPNEEPLFILSANTQSIDYTQSSIQYETGEYDLSQFNNTETFNLLVLSNFSSWHWKWTDIKYYYLSIYFSNNFVPLDDTDYTNNNYPIVPIYLNAVLNNESFSYFRYGWGTSKYIYQDQNAQNIGNQTINYGSRSVNAKKYGYYIYIPSGFTYESLIDFNFGWNGYTQPLNRYWDMEGYVRIELESI